MHFLGETKSMDWLEIAIAQAVERAREESQELWGEEGGEPRFNYRLEHIKAVVAIAEQLAEELSADREVVRAAAWLHDLAKDEVAEGQDGHGKGGAREAQKVLEGTDFPNEKIPRVMEAIAEHVGLFRDKPLEDLEVAILWDADKLSKLGATSLVHHLLTSPAWEPGITTERILEWYREWLGTAARIVKSMNTEPGRKMAEERYKFLEAFYRELAKELGDKK